MAAWSQSGMIGVEKQAVAVFPTQNPQDCLGVSCAVSKKSTELRKAQILWPGEACLLFGKLESIPGECLVSAGQVELGISSWTRV